MAKKRKNKIVVRPWCWYCEREFEDEKVLMQHQKAKHFKCNQCPRRLNTAGGLAVHIQQVHKLDPDQLPRIENAIPGRDGYEVEIFGMEGIPAPDVADYKRRKEQELGLPIGSISGSGKGLQQNKRPRVENRVLTEEELRGQLAAHRALMGGADAAPANAGSANASAAPAGPASAVYNAAPQTYTPAPAPAAGPPPPFPPGMPPPAPGAFPPPPGMMPPFPPPLPGAGFPPGFHKRNPCCNSPPPPGFPFPPPPPGLLRPMVPPPLPGMSPPAPTLGSANGVGAVPTPPMLPTPPPGPGPAAVAVSPPAPVTAAPSTPTPTAAAALPQTTPMPSTPRAPNPPQTNPALKAGTVLIWQDANYSPDEKRALYPKYQFVAPTSVPLDGTAVGSTPGTGPRGTKRARAEDYM